MTLTTRDSGPEAAPAERRKLWLALLLLGAVGSAGLVVLLGVGGANAVGSCGGGQSAATASSAPSPAGR